jgi:D-alanyl-D-alanine carboxypeptidase
MKRKFKNAFIIFSGLFVGVTIGYFGVFGIKNISNFIVVQAYYVKDKINIKEFSQGASSVMHNFDFFSTAESSVISYDKTFKISTDAPKIEINSKSFLVGDVETGRIILSKEKDKIFPIASITKLMTAIISDYELGLENIIRISKRAVSTYGRQGRLIAGEEYKISDILYALLLESSNDAAEAIAESVVRDNFLAKMNEKAKELKMYNTYFDDPSGLSSKNVSSVNNLFELSVYIYNNKSYIFDMTTEDSFKYKKKNWKSNSQLKNYDFYLGGKNGYTHEAGHTQVAILKTKVGEGYRDLVFIVLNTNDIKDSMNELKRYVESYVKYE